MKVKISSADLVRITASAADVAPPKAPMPVLGCVLLQTMATTGGHRLEASATDLFLSSRMSAGCETSEPGSVCVNAKALRDLAARLPEGSVSMVFDGRTLTVKSGRSKYKLNAQPADDMPPIPRSTDDLAPVPGAVLLRRLSSVASAMSTDESRAHIACVMLADTVAVATDGHRMHKIEGPSLGLSVLVPPKGVALLSKLAKAGDLDVSVGTDRLFARQGDRTVTVKTVDEAFPPYAKVIPDADKATVYRAPRGPLMDAVKRLAYVSGGPLRFRSVAGAVELAGQDVDTGEGSESVDCDATGETPWVGMNAKYMLDALAACDGDEVTLRVIGELDPVVVEDDGFLAVLMPLRI